jgi:hypothetical protein
MIGDLGDIGSASLTYKNICFMIESLLAMPGAPEQERLDLVARLLAIGQREYLSETEWAYHEDPIKDMEDDIERQVNHDNYLSLDFDKQSRENQKSCSEQDLSESPFATYILRVFRPKVDQVSESQDSAAENESTWKRVLQTLLIEEFTDQAVVLRIDVLNAAANLFPLGAC